MILQLLRQFLNNLDRCSASFCFGLSLRFPCPLPRRISSRILSKSMFIPQNHNKEYEHAHWKKSPYFGPRWHWACSKSNLTRSHISSDRVRSGYEIISLHAQVQFHAKYPLFERQSDSEFSFSYAIPSNTWPHLLLFSTTLSFHFFLKVSFVILGINLLLKLCRGETSNKIVIVTTASCLCLN